MVCVGDYLASLLGGVPLDPTMQGDTRKQALWRRANVPERHSRNRVSAEEAGGHWSAAHDRVVGSLGSGALWGLLGERGTGKTQIAVNSIAKCCAIGRPALYVKAMDVFLWVRSAFKDESVSELDALAEFLSPRLLVIDEVSERGETPYEDRLLVYLIDKRYDAMHDTILIANQTAQAFAESMGPSIVDRLRECGGLIDCSWPSFRGGAR